jgi:hypothetical protein
MTLSEVQERLPFRLISRHAKSHQDEMRAFADLTNKPEQLNVLADHRATATLTKVTEFYLQCHELGTVPHWYRGQVHGPWRHRFLIHLHRYLTETKLQPMHHHKGYREPFSHRRHERS